MSILLPPALMLSEMPTSELNEAESKTIELNSSPLQNESSDHSAAEAAEVNRSLSTASHSLCTMQDVVCRHVYLYYFFVVTGIIFPIPGSKRNWKRRTVYAILQCWVVLLYLSMAAVFMLSVLSAVSESIHYQNSSSHLTSVTNIFYVLFTAVQMACNYGSIILLRKEMTAVHFDLVQHYTSSLHAAVYRCTGMVVIIFLFSFVTLCLWRPGSFFIALLGLSSFPFVGAAALLINDQRVSHTILSKVLGAVISKTLTLDDYFVAEEAVSSSARTVSFSLLIIPAATSTAFAIVLLYLDTTYTEQSTQDPAGAFNFVAQFINSVAREITVLLLLLYEMARVNEVSERFLPMLARQPWNVDKAGEERVNLYMAAQQYPLGAKILGYQPSRNVIILQMVSTVVSLLFGLGSKQLQAQRSS